MDAKGNQSFWNEKWMPIVFDGIENPPHYEVSNYGRLRSFQTSSSARQNQSPGGPTSLIIKGSGIQGYRSLNIRSGGKTFNRYVHKLVAEHFVSQEQPDQLFVIHLDHESKTIITRICAG